MENRAMHRRVRAKISWHFGASAGRADARRRDAGDVVASSRSGNAADARPPPRPSGLRPAGPLAVLLAPYIPQRVCSSLAPCQRAWGPAAKCTPYFLTGPNLYKVETNANKNGLTLQQGTIRAPRKSPRRPFQGTEGFSATKIHSAVRFFWLRLGCFVQFAAGFCEIWYRLQA